MLQISVSTVWSMRASGSTAANSNSSGSYVVLHIPKDHHLFVIVHMSQHRQHLVKEHNHPDPSAVPRHLVKKVDKMPFIDLADSGRKEDTAMKECIRAWGCGDGSHVPFRGSTSTKVLCDSSIGDTSKVYMVAMVSPTHSDVKNTMNILRCTDRLKDLPYSDHGRVVSNENDEISNRLPIDDDKDNKRGHHHKSSMNSLSNNIHNDDGGKEEQPEAPVSYVI